MTDQEIRKPLDKISKSSGISAGWLALIIAFVVIIADQTLKIWIKTNFYIGEDYEIFRWFHIKFIENSGMAFGLELWNKLVLTFGRIIAVALFVWFIIKVKDIKGIRKGFIVAVALIAAGAAGNIFDCVFYGKIFNNPMPPQVAEIFPADGGYAGWFEGKVVDMLYFPFFDFYWPEWMPVVGGSYYEFFAYIFNIADSSICIGVALLILFYSKDASVAFKAIGGDSAKTESEAK
ncbi:lipoprotein signal peptidase [Muribaculaceae bacterium Isolate-113 (HZI)]|nr:lipoprotein signal peptidase [Muribaculaceae bacterium Isolate-114 (HZI)]ROT22332.1 lipoprotein signal peptidase [Muribaculaceae bacterium Isolate-113 (HZI)]